MTRRRDADAQKQLAQEVVRLGTSDPAKFPPVGDKVNQTNAQEISLALSFLKKAAITYRVMRPEDSKASGADAAHNLLNALTSGTDHPVWDYVDGLRAMLPNRREKAPVEYTIHGIVLATVEALRDGFGLTARDARAVIAKRLNKIPRFPKLKSDALRQWDRRLEDEGVRRFIPEIAREAVKLAGGNQKTLLDWMANEVSNLLPGP